MRNRSLRGFVLLLLGWVSLPLHAEEPNAKVAAFLRQYCVECHGPTTQKGDRRFDRLTLPIENVDALHEVQDILDQLNLGAMPPAKAKQPPAAEVRAIVQALTQSTTDGHAKLASTGGQTVLRRLNRREYSNTIGDLFRLNMSMFDPTTKFPRDEMVLHMDNIGDVLKTSGYLLAQYVDAADLVIEKIFAATEPTPEQTWRFTDDFRQQQELSYSHGQVQQFKYMCLYETVMSDKHEGAYGPLFNFKQGVPADGFYEIRVKAEAQNRKHPYDPRIFHTDPETPFRLGVVAGNIDAGPLHLPQPIEPLLGETTVADDQADWHTFRVWLDQGFTPRFTFPNGALSIRNAYGQVLRKYNDSFPRELRNTRGIVESRVVVMRHGFLPHIRIHEVEIRGPLDAPWPPTPQQAILGSAPFAPARTRELLTRFADRAYRRPLTPADVDRLVAVVDRRIKEGRSPFDAFKDGLKAVLCSPAFLYLAEPETNPTERRLTAHALASRLSYFLWSTLPDDELRRLADDDSLSRPEVLLTQARRMLSDRRSDALVTGLLESWLNLRALGDMAPDRDAFVNYYAQHLQPAMKQETQLFTRDLLDRNDSIIRFIDADYAFVNRPLAQLYGLPTVPAADGHVFRRVAVDATQRGGLLGQGSVLTVSANGIETSPVTRGVWLLENLLGTPPAPPPDNVPPIDPDIRGAKSIREILVRHRDNAGCLECHQKIDPLGFALESYDPIGAWRTHYDRKRAIPVDTTGELPDGRRFTDVAGLKQVLVQRKAQFARMLTERLLAYACGRRMEALDRPAIDRILETTRPDDYRFRELLEQIILSQAFRSK